MASLAWIVIGTILGVGIWQFAVKGNPWLLAVSGVAFVFAVGKIGCATH
jgi:hypothetical protein